MQDEEGVGGQDDPGVQHTVLQHGPLRPQGSGHRPDEQEAQQGDDPAAHRRRQHQQGEVLVGQRRLPLPRFIFYYNPQMAAPPVPTMKPSAPRIISTG